MNETIITCRYCSQPIQVGKGIYLEHNWEKGQMGWFHDPMCKWTIEAQWRQEEQPITQCQEGYEDPLNCTCPQQWP